MTNWVRHTHSSKDLGLSQFSFWPFAEFAKFFPFVTLHLAGPHVLFHASVWWVPNWPKGCMHYLRFILPKDFDILVVFIWLQNTQLLYHRRVTVSLGFLWLRSKKKSIETESEVWQVLKSIHCRCPSQTQDCGVLNKLLYPERFVRQPSIWLTPMEIGSFLKNSHPRMRLLYSCIFSISFKLIFCSTVNKWKGQYEWGIALGSSQIHLKLSHSITLARRSLKKGDSQIPQEICKGILAHAV